ncbi:hypothetical protein KIPB_007417 [Kipferlia bialata]|uniref:Uncharacterized protein n=1 Tax=Kipferlia bialata TaxID=797122 RepID=A0A9K3D157_9EUKA|nr:hypothetical protein KIPB_007417 [Kipferlia bialata]|eukprot:g7417.t1
MLIVRYVGQERELLQHALLPGPGSYNPYTPRGPAEESPSRPTQHRGTVPVLHGRPVVDPVPMTRVYASRRPASLLRNRPVEIRPGGRPYTGDMSTRPGRGGGGTRMEQRRRAVSAGVVRGKVRTGPANPERGGQDRARLLAAGYGRGVGAISGTGTSLLREIVRTTANHQERQMNQEEKFARPISVRSGGRSPGTPLSPGTRASMKPIPVTRPLRTVKRRDRNAVSPRPGPGSYTIISQWQKPITDMSRASSRHQMFRLSSMNNREHVPGPAYYHKPEVKAAVDRSVRTDKAFPV